MPSYEYRCRCGDRREVICAVSEHTSTLPCECGNDMTQVLGFQYVVPDIEPYQSMITGERIKGRAHHRQHLRQHGCIEIGNERQERHKTPLPSVAPDIKRAIEELKSR